MVFLKQYGEVRTGTNALRALVTFSCGDTVVLMHVLGSKHEPPVDLRAIGDAPSVAGATGSDLVEEATRMSPAPTTDLSDSGQRAHLDRVAGGVAAALRDRTLGILLSVKSPYAWADSWIRWRRRIGQVDPIPDSELGAACALACARHRAWLRLVDDGPFPASVVRFEDLVRRPADVVAEVADRHGLTATNRAPLGLVPAAHWDDAPIERPVYPFDAEWYLERRYMRRLGARGADVVRDSVDWALMERFGYGPHERAVT